MTLSASASTASRAVPWPRVESRRLAVTEMRRMQGKAHWMQRSWMQSTSGRCRLFFRSLCLRNRLFASLGSRPSTTSCFSSCQFMAQLELRSESFRQSSESVEVSVVAVKREENSSVAPAGGGDTKRKTKRRQLRHQRKKKKKTKTEVQVHSHSHLVWLSDLVSTPGRGGGG